MGGIYIIEASARKNGYSAQSARAMAEVFEEEGIDYTLDRAIEKKIGYCLACDKCRDESVDCVQKDDMLDIYGKLKEADALAIITPVAFSSVPAQLKSLLDRTQRFYNRKWVRKEPIPACIIAFGGARAYEAQFTAIPLVLKHFFLNITAVQAGMRSWPGTDSFPLKLPPEAETDVREMAAAIAGRVRNRK